MVKDNLIKLKKNKAPGIDLVGSRMLSISEEISDIVAELYNKSLTTGTGDDVSQDRKLASVTAVYKKGKKRAHLTIDRLV